MMPDAITGSAKPESNSGAGSVGQLAVRFGVGAGLVCAVWLLGLHLTGNNAFGPKQILAQLLVPMAALGSEWALRRQLRPERPGLGRTLAVGGLTTLLAAAVSAASVWGLAHGVGEPALAKNRAEILEIMRLQYQETPAKQRNAVLYQRQVQKVQGLTISELAVGNFTTVVLFGLALSLPGGIFFRE